MPVDGARRTNGSVSFWKKSYRPVELWLSLWTLETAGVPIPVVFVSFLKSKQTCFYYDRVPHLYRNRLAYLTLPNPQS